MQINLSRRTILCGQNEYQKWQVIGSRKSNYHTGLVQWSDRNTISVIRDVGNLHFRGFVVKNWNVPFTVEDFHESKQSVMRWF